MPLKQWTEPNRQPHPVGKELLTNDTLGTTNLKTAQEMPTKRLGSTMPMQSNPMRTLGADGGGYGPINAGQNEQKTVPLNTISSGSETGSVYTIPCEQPMVGSLCRTLIGRRPNQTQPQIPAHTPTKYYQAESFYPGSDEQGGGTQVLKYTGSNTPYSIGEHPSISMVSKSGAMQQYMPVSNYTTQCELIYPNANTNAICSDCSHPYSRHSNGDVNMSYLPRPTLGFTIPEESTQRTINSALISHSVSPVLGQNIQQEQEIYVARDVGTSLTVPQGILQDDDNFQKCLDCIKKCL